jgi:hypothetical protein
MNEFKMKLKKSIFLVIYLVFFVLSGCDFFGKDDPIITDDSYYVFWLAASKDAHVSSSQPDYNYDGMFSLISSHGDPNKEQRFYIKFFMPQLPAGTEVLEAYINIYEDSQTGQAGTVTIAVDEAVAEWDPYAITWNNQPNPIGLSGSAGGQIQAYVTNNMWRKTADIKGIAQKHLDDPDSNFGWLFNNSSSIPFTRSFKSMNALDARTQTELQLGPRLLMKVKSSTPLDANNIGTTITGSTELGNMYGFGTDIMVYLIQSGEEWPVEWEVATQ